MSVFINFTAHELLPEQKREVKKSLGANRIIELNPRGYLRKALSNTPPEVHKLIEISRIVLIYLDLFNNEDRIYIHLPAGSPAFMWILCRALYFRQYEIEGNERPNVIAVFSHSRRESTETKNEDGIVIKHSIFKFEKFIVIPNIKTK